jgi:hypothetical protein
MGAQHPNVRQIQYHPRLMEIVIDINNYSDSQYKR